MPLWEKIGEEQHVGAGGMMTTFRMSVPEGWMVIVRVHGQPASIAFTPDKSHVWGINAEPKEEVRS